MTDNFALRHFQCFLFLNAGTHSATKSNLGGFFWIVIFGLAAAGVGVYVVYKYRIRVRFPLARLYWGDQLFQFIMKGRSQLGREHLSVYDLSNLSTA